MKITGVELERTDILSILTDTLETNAIGYWAQYQSWKREPDDDKETALYVNSMKIKEMNDDESDYTIPHTINFGVIKTGVRLIVSGKVNAPYIREMILDEDIDSNGCDCIVQAGLFGEIKYG